MSGFALTSGLTFGAFWWALGRGWPGWRASVLGLLAVLPAQMVAAGATWLATDYPHWLVRDARSSLRVPAGPILCGSVRAPPEPADESRRP